MRGARCRNERPQLRSQRYREQRQHNLDHIRYDNRVDLFMEAAQALDDQPIGAGAKIVTLNGTVEYLLVKIKDNRPRDGVTLVEQDEQATTGYCQQQLRAHPLQHASQDNRERQRLVVAPESHLHSSRLQQQQTLTNERQQADDRVHERLTLHTGPRPDVVNVGSIRELPEASSPSQRQLLRRVAQATRPDTRRNDRPGEGFDLPLTLSQEQQLENDVDAIVYQPQRDGTIVSTTRSKRLQSTKRARLRDESAMAMEADQGPERSAYPSVPIETADSEVSDPADGGEDRDRGANRGHLVLTMSALAPSVPNWMNPQDSNKSARKSVKALALTSFSKTSNKLPPARDRARLTAKLHR